MGWPGGGAVFVDEDVVEEQAGLGDGRAVGHQGDFAQAAGLVNGVRQRLLAEAVLTHFHGHHTGGHVDVIRRANHYCIDLALHLGQHLAEVYILFGRGEFFGSPGQPPFIHVA